ncbi:DDE-type integrase/transposase/recombinase [Rhizobium leguminosarum]|uniref:DDE-type integrase/transposase/recombinase n=1 Tax=Rhizobium leguminosarum TaxID=384 RepID=UPI00391C9EC9
MSCSTSSARRAWKAKILKEALEMASGPKKAPVAVALVSGPFSMTAVCETLDVARSNIAERVKQCASNVRGRLPLADHEPVDEIKAIIDDMPTNGYRRVHAILRRNASRENRPGPNAKRVYRVKRFTVCSFNATLAQSKPIATMAASLSSNPTCVGVLTVLKTTEKVRVAFALDCFDRKAIAHVATTEGIKSEDVQDLVITAVEDHFGRINILPKSIEWLTDNGSCFIAADTKSLLLDIVMEPRTKQVRSPRTKGMAEAFDKTFKRDSSR